MAQATFLEPSSEHSIGSRFTLRHDQDRPLDFPVADSAVRFPFDYDAAEHIDLGPYLLLIYDQARPLLSAWRRQFWGLGQVVETYLPLEWINKAITTGFVYQQREQPRVQTPGVPLSRRAGSCRGFRHPVYRVLPVFEVGGALCQRLVVHACLQTGLRCNPCTVGSLSAWRRLERIRFHRWPGRRQRPHYSGRKPPPRIGTSRLGFIPCRVAPVADDAGAGHGRGNPTVAPTNDRRQPRQQVTGPGHSNAPVLALGSLNSGAARPRPFPHQQHCNGQQSNRVGS